MEGIPMRSAGISTSDRERTGIRENCVGVQDMQDVWSLPLSCLLVCQSAIFIGSKRDGTEPFNGRREPRWTGNSIFRQRVKLSAQFCNAPW